MAMRAYIAALTLAVVLIVAGIVFVRSTFGQLDSDFEQQREKLKE